MEGGPASEQITYPGKSGAVQAYVARPATGEPWPAIIVVRALLSSVDYINQKADRLAREGYLAIAPNHYANDPVVQRISTEDILAGIGIAHAPDINAALEGAPPAKRETMRRVVEWWDTRDTTYLADLFAAIDYVKRRPDVQPTCVAVAGFGGAGLLTGKLVTAGADLAAAVVYSGRPPGPEEAANVRCPVLGHYGSEDRGNASRVPALEEAMEAAGKTFIAHIYEGAHHLFFDETHKDYEPDAAALAWERTLEFLRRSMR